MELEREKNKDKISDSKQNFYDTNNNAVQNTTAETKHYYRTESNDEENEK